MPSLDLSRTRSRNPNRSRTPRTHPRDATVFAVGAAHLIPHGSVSHTSHAHLCLPKLRAFYRCREGLHKGCCPHSRGPHFHTSSQCRIPISHGGTRGVHPGATSLVQGAHEASSPPPSTQVPLVSGQQVGVPPLPPITQMGSGQHRTPSRQLPLGQQAAPQITFVDRAFKHTYVVTRITSFTCIGAASIDPANIAEGLRADSGLACAVGYALADRLRRFFPRSNNPVDRACRSVSHAPVSMHSGSPQQ